MMEPNITSISFSPIIDSLQSVGYAHISGSFYNCDDNDHELKLMQSTYNDLLPDIYSPGNRFRGYKKFIYDPFTENLIAVSENSYFQSKSYNNIDGNKQRDFSEINHQLLNTSIFFSLLKNDIAIVKDSGILSNQEPITIGIHQIRYSASPKSPSFSSPLWLHKDDESIVFIHLFNITNHILGGDLLISHDKKTIDDIISLDIPLDTLIVTQKHYHALTPIGTNNGSAFRDILLITFSQSNDKESST